MAYEDRSPNEPGISRILSAIGQLPPTSRFTAKRIARIVGGCVSNAWPAIYFARQRGLVEQVTLGVYRKRREGDTAPQMTLSELAAKKRKETAQKVTKMLSEGVVPTADSVSDGGIIRRMETLTGEVLTLKSLLSRLEKMVATVDNMALLARVDKVEKIIGIK